MDWLLAAGGVVVGAGLTALFFVYVVVPQERAEAKECAEKAAKAYAEGLKAGSAIIQAQAAAQVAQVDAQAVAVKQADPVATANDLIAGAKS